MSGSGEQLREIVADLVRRTPSIGSTLVREHSVFSRRKEDEPLNAFVAKLSVVDRETLASILQKERTAALFDSLVWLHESCAVHGIRLQLNGTELQLEPDGYTIFEEYLGLLRKVSAQGEAL